MYFLMVCLKFSGGNYGGVGGGATAPQFNMTRKFSVEVRNFEGGIETARKKRVIVEKQRVSI